MDSKMGAAAAVKQLDGWTVTKVRDAIEKTFLFKDFNQAFGFMARVSLRAEQLDHHPEWFNVYNRVEVLLSTHDADGVTKLDLELAGFMDKIAKEMDHE